MEPYVYYRILDHLLKYQRATKSDLILISGLGWTKVPIEFLYEKGFIGREKGVQYKLTGSHHDVVYYFITEKGIEFNKKLEEFCKTYDKLYEDLNQQIKRFVRSRIVNDIQKQN